jgi:hypothetical protein
MRAGRRRLPPSVAALLSFAFLSCSAVVAAKELDAVPSAKLVVSDSGEWTFGPDDFAAADPIIADGSVAGAAATSLSFPLSSPSVDHQTVIFVNMASTAPPPPQTGQLQEQQAAPVTSPAIPVTSPHATDDGTPAAGQSQSQMPTSQPSASPLSSSTATAGTGESGGGDAGLAPTPTPESSGKGGSSGGNGGISTSASTLTSESPGPADVGVAATSAVPSATKADLSSGTQSFASAKTDNGGPNTNIAHSQTPPESLPGGTTSNDNGAFAAGTQVPAPITEETPEPARGSKGDGFESLGPSTNAATTNGDSSSTLSPPDFVSPTGSNAAVGVSADPSKTDTSAIEPVTVDQTANSGATTTTPTVTQRTSATKNDAVVEANSSGGGVSITRSTSPPAIVVAAKSPNPTPGTEGGDSSATGTGPPATSVPAETPNPTPKTEGGVTSTSPATSPPAIVVAAVSSNPTPETSAGASAAGVTGPANTTPASVGGNKGGLSPATTQPASFGTSQQSDSGGVIIGAPIGGGSAPADTGSAGTGAPLTTAPSSSVGTYAPVYYTDAVGTSAVSVAVTKAPSYYTDAARSSSFSTAVTEAPPPVPSVVAIAPPSTQPPSSGGDETIFVSFGGTTAAPLTTAGFAASTATAPLAAAKTTGAPIDVAVSALSPTPVIEEGGNNNNSLTSVILAPPQEPVAQVSPLPSSSPPAVPVKPTTDGETIIVAGESPAPSPSTRPSPVPETPVVPVNGNVTSDPTPTPSAADSKTSNGDAEGVNGATPSENNSFGTRKTGRGFAAGMGVLGTLLLLLLAVCLFFACFRGNKYSYYSGPSQDAPRGKGSYDTGPSQAAAARPRDNGATLDEWGYNDTERIDDMTGGGAGGFDRRSDDGSETQGISRDQARATFDSREMSGGGGRDRGSSDEYEYDSFTATEQAPAGNRRSTYRYDSRETDPVAADLVPPSRPAPSPPPPPPPLPPSMLGRGMERPGVPPPPPPPLLPPRRPGGSLSQANVTAASSQAPFEPLRRQFAEPPSVAQPALMDSFEGCRSTTPPGTTNEPVSSGAQGRREDAGPNITGGEVEGDSAVVSESSYAVSQAKGSERVYSGDAQCEEDQAPWPYFGADDSASSSGDDIHEERSKPTSLREGTENATKERENVESTKQPNPFLLMDRVDFAKRNASSSPVGMEGTTYIPLPDSGPLISYLRGKRPMSTSSRKSANDEGSETSRSVVQTSAAELRRMREPFVKQQAARLSSEEDSSTASTGETRQQKSALRDTPKCPIEWLPRSDGSQVT